MGWDEIKYSLNSTLGTAKHRPLNTQIDELKNTVGATNDAAGSATAGTVMGKLRNCIERLETIRTYTVTNNTASTTGNLSQKLTSAINNTATNNTANATGILSQKLSYIINNLIGATNNTGGSSRAGTVMAKLNTLMKRHVNSLISNTTSVSVVSSSSSLPVTTRVCNLSNVIVYSLYALRPYYYSSSGNTNERGYVSMSSPTTITKATSISLNIYYMFKASVDSDEILTFATDGSGFGRYCTSLVIDITVNGISHNRGGYCQIIYEQL